jgi:hypothetical protein
MRKAAFKKIKMRNKIAKKLKMNVALAMYVGDDVTAQDVRNDRKSVFASTDFKPVYRARKKNYSKTEQVVYVKPDDTPPEVLSNMREARLKKDKFRKAEIRERKIGRK